MSLNSRKCNLIRPFTVAIEGNIASGKTTALKFFQDKEQFLTVPEPVDKLRDVHGHNLLELMYKDPKRWCMLFQSYYQLTMMENYNLKTTAPVKIMERSIFSARHCFIENLHAEGHLSDVELVVLDEWFTWIINNLDVNVDLIVYLRTKPEVVWERISGRRRSEEQEIPLQYLKDLHNIHEKWIADVMEKESTKVLILDGNKDIVEVEKMFEQHKDLICNKKPLSTNGHVLKEISNQDINSMKSLKISEKDTKCIGVSTSRSKSKINDENLPRI